MVAMRICNNKLLKHSPLKLTKMIVPYFVIVAGRVRVEAIGKLKLIVIKWKIVFVCNRDDFLSLVHHNCDIQNVDKFRYRVSAV